MCDYQQHYLWPFMIFKDEIPNESKKKVILQLLSKTNN